MKKFKVLQICAVDFTVQHLLAPLIVRLSKEFDVTTVCSNGQYIQELREQGFKIHPIEIERKISPINNLKSIYQLYKFMKQEKFDIVHVHTPVAAVLGRIAAKLAGVHHIVYTAHGFYFHDQMPKMTYNLFFGIEKIMGNFLTHYIFTQSKEDRDLAVKNGIISADRIRCISNGVNLSDRFDRKKVTVDLKTLRNDLGIANQEKVICFIGRLVKEKGILDLLQAFILLVQEYNHVKLVIVGSTLSSDRDQETGEAIEELSNNPLIKDKIIFTGKRNDVENILAISDLFVLPSYREGMPRSIIEAMAMSLPVVATNIRGCREEVVPGETGYLVPVGDTIALKDALVKIISNEELQNQMGKRGRERAESLYDERRVLETQIQIFNELLKKDGVGHNEESA